MKWAMLLLVTILVVTGCAGNGDDDADPTETPGATATTESGAANMTPTSMPTVNADATSTAQALLVPTATTAPTRTATASPTDTPEPTPTSAPTATAQPTLEPTATLSPVAEDTPTAPPDQNGDDSDLERALLTIEDFPAGWVVIDFPDSGNDDDSPFVCDVPDPSDVVGHGAEADAAFQGGDLGPFYYYAIRAFASADDAEIVMQLLREGLTCQEWEDEDGLVWMVSAVDFPEIGDETLAYRLSFTDESVGIVEFDMVFTRVDDVILFTNHFTLGAVDHEFTIEYASKATQKVIDEL